MPKMYLPDVPADERLQVLRNHADKVEETTYERELTMEELDAKREEFVDNSIAVSSLEDELSLKKAEYKGKIDPIKLKNVTTKWPNLYKPKKSDYATVNTPTSKEGD